MFPGPFSRGRGGGGDPRGCALPAYPASMATPLKPTLYHAFPSCISGLEAGSYGRYSRPFPFWRIPAGILANMAVPLSTTQFRSGLEAGSMAVLPAFLRGGVYDCSVSGRECRWLPAFFCCRERHRVGVTRRDVPRGPFLSTSAVAEGLVFHKLPLSKTRIWAKRTLSGSSRGERASPSGHGA